MHNHCNSNVGQSFDYDYILETIVVIVIISITLSTIIIIFAIIVILNNFLDIKDKSTTAIALDYLKSSTSLLPEETLIRLLNHKSIKINLYGVNFV